MSSTEENNNTRNAKIRELNDNFREHAMGNGSILITSGVQALGQEKMTEVIALVQHFTAFSEDNDPHDEHDFGAVTIADAKVFWKIDYYDLTKSWHSPDPADEAVTHRVLTIMFTSEY